MEQLDSLSQLIIDLDNKTGVEAAVVIINDFNSDQDDFTFATALFRHWGIGKSKADNGLLLFISISRRQYRFITGYGLEGLLPDATLKTIGDRIIKPSFKQQDYGPGIINTFKLISSYLQQPANSKELNSLLAHQASKTIKISNITILLGLAIVVAFAAGWQLNRLKFPLNKNKPFTQSLYADISGWSALGLIAIAFFIGVIAFFTGHVLDLVYAIPAAIHGLICVPIILYFWFAHLNILSKLRRQYKDDVNYIYAVSKFYRQTWWHLILSPILLIPIAISFLYRNRVKKRIKPSFDNNGKPMVRIDRDTNEMVNDYLLAGQQKEEDIRSLVYDIWISSTSKEYKLVANHGYDYNNFQICPTCGFRTFTVPIEVIIKRANYLHGGMAKRVKLCRNCNYEDFIQFISLDKLVRSKPSSGTSKSSSSSSGSSNSSSGSWGGGSTGGGGAGGKW
ncbi:MAG: TPM domain-containing protein [Pedobacter sp.]|nr:MAG: TPM domain-containing protein [Pedobacter sp.]